VTAEIFKLWRLAGEAVMNGFPRELSDGTKRFHVFAPPFIKDGIYPTPG
jgi:hypothetical protein